MPDLSFCITVKNRSRGICSRRTLTLFPNCVRALRESLDKVGNFTAELVVADWNSTDWPLVEWLPAAWGDRPCRVITPDPKTYPLFSRGQGRNMAAKAAVGEVIAFIDADMLVSPETIWAGLTACGDGRACFPQVMEYYLQGETRTRPMPWGTGNSFVLRRHFEMSNGWFQYSKWGFEDWGFMVSMANVAMIERPLIPTFIHQWHPDDWRTRNDVGGAKETFHES